MSFTGSLMGFCIGVKTDWKLVNSDGLDISAGLGKTASAGSTCGHLYAQRDGTTETWVIPFEGASASVGISIPTPVTVGYSTTGNASYAGTELSRVFASLWKMGDTADPCNFHAKDFEGLGVILTLAAGGMNANFYASYYFFGTNSGWDSWLAGQLGVTLQTLTYRAAAVILGASVLLNAGGSGTFSKVYFGSPYKK